MPKPLLSVVVPIYNEEAGLAAFHKSLLAAIKGVGEDFEIIYVDDGSTDNGAGLVRQWHKQSPNIKLLKLSRNFGKENALSAGISAAEGQAVLTIDGDGQHPVELIPEFVKAWQNGAQIAIGLRENGGAGGIKHTWSRLFYKTFNLMTSQKLVPGSTDFRLIDQSVRLEFLRLRETNRMTRGLIDWLGFRREFISFKPNLRADGTPGYSFRRLVHLAANSFVSFSPRPLYLFGYLGVLITLGAFLLGAAVFLEQVLLGDPWQWKFTGTAMLGILTLFLVGILLLSQGMLSLYISHIHSQSKQRPLYVINRRESAGIKEGLDDKDI
jgi:glycosyltransferase involved in cell wall biosynthesis